jgi:hypothetical protein
MSNPVKENNQSNHDHEDPPGWIFKFVKIGDVHIGLQFIVVHFPLQAIFYRLKELSLT